MVLTTGQINAQKLFTLAENHYFASEKSKQFQEEEKKVAKESLTITDNRTGRGYEI
jgi:hypothetical protein